MTRAAADEYDAIVIGAGHNGLCAAFYLTQQGYHTLVLERAACVGGMARCDQDLLEGFWHHSHANFLSYLDLRHSGAIDFRAIGVEVLWPDAQHGICFRDGRPPLILYRPDQPERTKRSIDRFSPKDARTYLRVKSRADALNESLREAFYSPPETKKLDRYRKSVLDACDDLGLSRSLRTADARSVIDVLFESVELRTLLYRLTLEFGGNLFEEGSGAAFIGYIMWMLGRRRIPLHGMSSVASALQSAVERQGGAIHHDEVAEILVEGGRAAAVLTRGGRRIAARKCIAAAVSVNELYSEVVDETVLPAEVRSSLVKFRAATATSVGSSKLCLREAPRYRAAALDSDIDMCLQTFIGLDEPQDVLQAADDLRRGYFPPPNAAVRVNSLWDPSQALDRCHAAGADTIFPSTQTMTADMISGLRRTYASALLECWAEYAPNMDAEAVLAQEFLLSSSSERKLLLREGDEQYRVGIDGLYLCGAETYPGGGVHGACAYNAAQVIIRDCNVGRQ